MIPLFDSCGFTSRDCLTVKQLPAHFGFLPLIHGGKKFTSYKEDCSPYSVATEVLYCSAEPPCGQLHVGVHLWTNGCIYPVGHMGRAYGIR